MGDVTEQWRRDLEAVLDPGAVWKHGALVAARREIERLRGEVDAWKAVVPINAADASESRSHP